MKSFGITQVMAPWWEGDKGTAPWGCFGLGVSQSVLFLLSWH